jgi:teichoic acid transport system ATP-binding protein
MTGLLPIDSGRIRVRSRPRLLGVGTAALRGGVSGRLNLIIGGLAVGLPLKDIQSRLDELIEFVGIGDAIDRPIKSYSSGMRARLNFTVATLTQPDILLVDEALAVGDAAFIKRSQERIDEILAHAGTVIMVSHNVDSVVDECDRLAWLKDGVLQEVGNPARVAEAYLADAEQRERNPDAEAAHMERLVSRSKAREES